MIKCGLCGYEADDKNDFFAVLSGGSTSYECGWDLEKACRRRQDAFRKREREKESRNLKKKV